MFIFTKRRIIKEFASKIAELQRRADEWYYKPHIKDYVPEKGSSDHASWLLDKIDPLDELCKRLGIIDEVYTEAYKIYDFRHSGENGYMLIDGKIVFVGSDTKAKD